MPKLRNAETDVGRFAQYLARKVAIHKPQGELDMVPGAREKMPRTYREAGDHRVHMLHQPGSPYPEPNVFLAVSDNGRAMKVTVEEVDPEAYAPQNFRPVGA